MKKNHILAKAKSYLSLCYKELDKSDEFQKRWNDVKESIFKTGTYELNEFELSYGAKVAWRNSNRCIGRLFWNSLKIIDCRKLLEINDIYSALFDHIEFATDNGNIKSTISIFNRKLNIKIWNAQLIGYAGYKEKNGTIIGDPKNINFTKHCLKLGWRPKKTEFDILPIVIKIGSNPPEFREIPKNIIKIIKISHPKFPKFKNLNLQWYSTPIISNMTLEIGGLEFHAAPFNGWYMLTEIGARNLSDENRYNKLQEVAKVIGEKDFERGSLWKDKSLIELNYAILYSFKRDGVKIIDHHSASKQFLKFLSQEKDQERKVNAEWSWIIPPLSPSTLDVFHNEYENKVLSPNYFYDEDNRDNSS